MSIFFAAGFALGFIVAVIVAISYLLRIEEAITMALTDVKRVLDWLQIRESTRSLREEKDIPIGG